MSESIGEKGSVVADKTHEKYATARSFGTCWSKKVKQVILQLLMRHADISTTMSYYVEHDVWRQHKAESSRAVPVTLLVTPTPPRRKKKARMVL